MSKKHNQPAAKTAASAFHAPKPAAPPAENIPAFFRNTKLQTWLIFAAALLLYAQSLMHGFVLDDSLMIAKNPFTVKGLAGIPEIFSHEVSFGATAFDRSSELVVGGRYRPLSLAMFAAIHQFFGTNPVAYHLVELLLFGLLCAVFYSTMLRLFGRGGYGMLLAWLAAVLFVVHPIHSEVVNNVKSCDEILSLLFSLTALNLSLKSLDDNRLKSMLWATLAFVAACFSKENAAAFLLIIPLAIFTKLKLEKNTSIKPRGIFKLKFLPLLAAFLFFFIVRGNVLNWSTTEETLNLINNAFVKYVDGYWQPFSFGERYATIMYTLGKYIQLLFYPHPLTTDYYPRHISIKTFSDMTVWAAIIINAALFFYALVGFIMGKRDAVRFGILFYFLSLFIVSNIPFSLGTNMAERFAFMPSAGFSIAIAGLVCAAIARWPQSIKFWLSGFGLVAAAFAVRTMVRNPAFLDNQTLVLTDVKTSPNSAKIQNAAGSMRIRESMSAPSPDMRREKVNQALVHFNLALQIHPTYAEAFFGRGSTSFLLRNFDFAIDDFEKSLEISPGRPEVLNNLATAYFELGKQLVELDGDMKYAVENLQKAEKMSPGTPETLFYMGVAYSKSGNQNEAVRLLRSVIELKPDHPQAYGALKTAMDLGGK